MIRRLQRGVTIPMVALMIFVLLVMAALAIDLGILYTARTSAQHAADAAALAGAYTFTQPTAVQPNTAINAAIAVASANKILGQPVTITAANIVVDTNAFTVQVTVPRTGGNGIGTYFARVLMPKVNVQVVAKAQAFKGGTGSNCLKPIFVPNTILSSLQPSQACTSNPQQIIFDGNGNLTTWAQSKLGQYLNPIRPTSPSGALTPSQFYSLDFGSGAATYRCTIGQCLNYCSTSGVKCGDSFPVETGDMVGPTRQGVNTLIGNPADKWVNIDQYYHPTTGITDDSSRSLAIFPVWDNCKQSLSPGYHGQAATIVGFVQMFVDGYGGAPTPGIQAHLVSEMACSTINGGNNGEGTGPFGVPVRLIQIQQQP